MVGERVRPWVWVVVSVLGLGVVSLLSNVTTTAQLSGADQGLFALRRTASLLLNAGTLWAGVSVLAGWLVRRPTAAAAAGLLAGAAALGVHYGAGELTGLMPPGSFASNAMWFAAAAVTGAPLGLVGAAARSHSGWGRVAALVVPTGAVLEPWAVGWWQATDALSQAVRMSNAVAAVILTAAGLAGAWFAAGSSGRQVGRGGT